MKLQVISRDQYGTTVILETTTTAEAAINRIRQEVTNLNFENALTTDDKYRNIEAFFPVFADGSGDIEESLIYAGNNTDGKHRRYRIGSAGEAVLEFCEDDAMPVFYIGTVSSGDAFLQDTKGHPVSKFKHELLEGKTSYFVKVIP